MSEEVCPLCGVNAQAHQHSVCHLRPGFWGVFRERDKLEEEVERQRSVIRSQNRNIAELSAEVERLKGSVQGTALAVFSNSEKAIDDLQAAAEYVASRIEREYKGKHPGAVAMFNEKEGQMLIDVLRGEIKP